VRLRLSFFRPRIARTPGGFIMTAIALIASGLASACFANDCGDDGLVNEVAEGIYVRVGKHAPPFEATNVANIGFVIGESCVAVIDSGAGVADGEALLCAVRETTTLPICYLLLTHHHFDHVMGNSVFANALQSQTPSLEIIAHEKLAPALQQSAEYYLTRLSDDANNPLPSDLIVLPTQTVKLNETTTVDLGGRSLELTAFGPAHTNNDISILDSKTNTLWSSDLLFVEHVPTIDGSFGSINGWLDVIDKLQAVNAEIAVPGHGPASVPWPGGGDPMRRYLSVVRQEIRAIIADNGSLDDAQARVGLSEATQWRMFEHHHRRSVINAFTELEWE